MQEIKKSVDDIIAISNAKCEKDFKLFLRSGYVENRVIIVDTCASHMQVMHTYIPPITKIIENNLDNNLRDGSPQLPKSVIPEYTIITIRSEVRLNSDDSGDSQLRYINQVREEIHRSHSGFKTIKAQGDTISTKPLIQGQVILGVVCHEFQYGFNRLTYSRLEIFDINDQMKTSKYLAKFENGREVRV
ncbi:hypothetical protein ACFLTW_01675 [Chloroflexota bacterium]